MCTHEQPNDELVRVTRELERRLNVQDHDEKKWDGLRFGLIDFGHAKENAKNFETGQLLSRHYEALYGFVRECQSVRKEFLAQLQKDDRYTWICYDILTKLVTFHYDIFNTVLDEVGAAASSNASSDWVPTPN